MTCGMKLPKTALWASGLFFLMGEASEQGETAQAPSSSAVCLRRDLAGKSAYLSDADADLFLGYFRI